MVVTTITAVALAAGSSLGAFSSTERAEALFVLGVVTGLTGWVAILCAPCPRT